jgi:uncharacterized membrane protein YhaH (DUF805 family)
MKNLIWIFIIISIGMLIFNAFLIDFDDPLVNESLIAVIGVFSSLCSFLLLLILLLSLKIKRLKKRGGLH